jgi:hypothetical protein
MIARSSNCEQSSRTVTSGSPSRSASPDKDDDPSCSREVPREGEEDRAGVRKGVLGVMVKRRE